jgi:hypothetical protein
MNRYNFMESSGTKPARVPDTIPTGIIQVGQRWVNTINGNIIHILERTHREAWVVREMAKGALRVHDEGMKELRELYILEFFKQI